MSKHRNSPRPDKDRPKPPVAKEPPLLDPERKIAEDAVLDLVEDEGFQALHLTITPTRTVRLTLDREERPVDISACTFMNHRVRRALEDAGLNPDFYAIEVESPGIKRELKTLRHFERFLGESAKIRLAEETEILGTIRATIDSIHEGRIHVVPDDGEPFSFTLDELRSARLDPSLTRP